MITDLNLIEHLWDEVGRRVRRRVNSLESVDQLQGALRDEWNTIPQAFVMHLIGYMRRRCFSNMTNSTTSHYPTASKSVGFLYTTISETFPTTTINTQSSVAKFQIKLDSSENKMFCQVFIFHVLPWTSLMITTFALYLGRHYHQT
jgi:hypothetical protein